MPGGVAADLQPLNDIADRADGFDQAPERAEQAEEDKQAGHVARDVARSRRGAIAIESVRLRMVCGEIAVRLPRSPRIAAIGASSTGARSARDAGIGQAESVDPGDFRKQPQHLPERQHDADQQHADDQRIEAGIGEERLPDLAVQDETSSPPRIRNTSIRTRKIRGEETLNRSTTISRCAMAVTVQTR